MDLVQQYIQKNEGLMKATFQSMCQSNKMEASKVFSFFQNIFNRANIRFQINDKNFFQEDENSSIIQKVIQSYYKLIQENEQKKFYIYRIQFTFQQIKSILRFWVQNEAELRIVYIEQDDKKKIQTINQAHLQKQNKLEMRGNNSQDNVLNQLMQQKIEKDNNQEIKNSKTDSPKLKQKKAQINFKTLFQYYAKLAHLTGVNSSFSRIERETQAVTYQKLAHFLKQYDLMPQSVAEKKKVYTIYMKNCTVTRDLELQGFINTLEEISDILFHDKPKQDRFQLLKQKIYAKIRGGNRNQNWQINYSFKLRPQQGKFINEVNDSLQKRRNEKQQIKKEKLKVKQQTNLRYLKKLSSIDPFHAEVIKNANLLSGRSSKNSKQSIANYKSMEKHRDPSFDFHSYFKIQHDQDIQINKEKMNREKPLLQYENALYSKSSQLKEQALKIQKDEQQKMNNLMNGIMKRSIQKIQKMGLSPSPNKKEKTGKYF